MLNKARFFYSKFVHLDAILGFFSIALIVIRGGRKN